MNSVEKVKDYYTHDEISNIKNYEKNIYKNAT